MKKTYILIFLLALLGFLLAPAVHADFVVWPPPPDPTADIAYYLTSNHITDGEYATSPFGIVELWQDDGNVNVKVSLYNDNEFVRTGSGGSSELKANFLFNPTGVAQSDLIDWTYGANEYYSGAAVQGDGFGYMTAGVWFDGQGPGASDSQPGPLGFTVLDATIADVTAGNSDGITFVADIILGSGNTEGLGASIGKTGAVDATSPVPIPAAAWIFGTGLFGLVGIRRKLRS